VTIWIDAQLSPALAPWIQQEFGVDAFSARYLGLVRTRDRDIFAAARRADVVVLTKDGDFPLLVERLGPPPSVIWLRCGNTSNAYVRKVLRDTLRPALDLIAAGEHLIVITDIGGVMTARGK
jgi:predicted nuclease of predicted toxin-antitoxin system